MKHDGATNSRPIRAQSTLSLSHRSSGGVSLWGSYLLTIASRLRIRRRDEAQPKAQLQLSDFTPQGIPVDDQGRPRADLNLDCSVDLRDFAIFQNSLFGP